MTYSLSHIPELIPVGLAMVAMFASIHTLNKRHTSIRKVQLILGILASLLLVVAQLSWFSTLMYSLHATDSSIIDGVWSIFNSLVMLLIASYAVTKQ